ncbi:MAG: MBL fold metallo-hydrolase, partial [Sedimentisphaerales bacterium]|nr:MBL fold metallo-hydrolase [Sedimentisphaerales bacterium]
MVGGHRAAAQLRLADLNADGTVNFADFSKLGQYWGQSQAVVDIAPLPAGDGNIDFKDIAFLARHWLEEYPELGYIKWLGHASVKMWQGDNVIYVDPRNLSESPHDATLVLVTHTHGDHYSASDIGK